METAEAIMGVTKVLMASNDTLFNFEDTLGDRDRDDLLISPRNYPKTNSNTTTSTDDASLIIEGQNLLRDDDDDDNDSDMNTFHINEDVTVLKEGLRLFKLKNTIEEVNVHQAINDLLSPEQQKTFSEEIHTMEQLSSDLSGTIEATYTANTLDDLKTCISVHSKDDMSSSTSPPISNMIDAEIAIKSNNAESHGKCETNDDVETDCAMVQLTFVENLETNSDAAINHVPVPENNTNLELFKNNVQSDNECNYNDRIHIADVCESVNEIIANNSSSQGFTNDTKENQNPNIVKLLDKRPKLNQKISENHTNQLSLNTKIDVANIETKLCETQNSIVSLCLLHSFDCKLWCIERCLPIPREENY